MKERGVRQLTSDRVKWDVTLSVKSDKGTEKCIYLFLKTKEY